MKPNIHPDYHKITVKLTNGETFETYSTYGKEGSEIRLDIDPTTHPAWTGATSFINENAGSVAKFKQRFAGLSFGKKSTKEEDK